MGEPNEVVYEGRTLCRLTVGSVTVVTGAGDGSTLQRALVGRGFVCRVQPQGGFETEEQNSKLVFRHPEGED